jgi:hypothetical protein
MFLKWGDIQAAVAHVDDSDVLDRARTNAATQAALEMYRPENWAGTGLTPEQILPVAQESGIPVVWIPSYQILGLLARARHEDRPQILRAHSDEILDQCHERLAECTDPWVAGPHSLLSRSAEALQAGHHEAAMALAVSVGEPLARWASVPRVHVFLSQEEADAWVNERRKHYKLAELELADLVSRGKELARWDVQRVALISPIPKFFTDFTPGEPHPESLSRHVVAHDPTPEHMSPHNALVALMLTTSILRQQQEWSIEVRMQDEAADDGHE